MGATCSGDEGSKSLEDYGINLQAALRLSGLNGGDAALLKLIVPAVARFPGFRHDLPASTYVGLPRWEPNTGEYSETGALNGHILLLEDEDVPKDSYLQRLATVLISQIFAVEHSYEPFETAEEGDRWIQNAYGDLWPRQEEFDYIWKFDTNEDHEYLAFIGLGSHLIRKVRENDKHVPDNAVYVMDLTEWALFEVGEGFARYGCSVFFDGNKKILGIWVCYLNRYIPRDDPDEWRHALYMYRVSLFIQVAETDHVISAHLGVSTALVMGSRQALPTDHPLRRLLKPFIFRSANVNYKIMYRLGAEKGLLSRAAAFPDPELTNLMIYFSRKIKFPAFSDVPRLNGMEDEPPEEYSFGDAVGYSAIVRKFVRSYCDIYYGGDYAKIEADPYAHRMICIIRQRLMQDYDSVDYDEFIETLTTCIVGVSGWHEHVGTVAQYMTRADGLTAKVRPGQTIADHQAFAVASIVGCVTSISSPRLMNDWTFLCLEDEHRDATKACWETFMTELDEYNRVIEDINSRRPVPSHSFYPKYLEAAVSV